MEKLGVSIVLGSYNRRPFLKETIRSIRKEIELADFPIEIIVVDGGSTDGSIRWLTKQKDIISIIQHNRGNWKGKKIVRQSWGYFMNLGFKSAKYKYICMVSDDCLIVPGAVVNGYNQFEKRLDAGENLGALAFYWRNWPEEEEYHANVTLGQKLMVNHGMYLNKALKDVGYINEDDYMFYCADGDLCLRLWENGYTVIDAKKSFIEHYSHANFIVRRTNGRLADDDFKMYHEKWKDIYPINLKQVPLFIDANIDVKKSNVFKRLYSFDLIRIVKKFRK